MLGVDQEDETPTGWLERGRVLQQDGIVRDGDGEVTVLMAGEHGVVKAPCGSAGCRIATRGTSGMEGPRESTGAGGECRMVLFARRQCPPAGDLS